MPNESVLHPIGPKTQRIESIDVMRGVIILGILAVNIQLFAMVEAAFNNPLACQWIDRANLNTWFFSHVLIGMKDLSIFSMLFGAGIIMMSTSDRTQQQVTKLHYRRMIVMLGFGLIHAYIIWYGDILYTYALCGMVVFWCRTLRPRTQLILGLGLYSVAMIVLYIIGAVIPLLPDEVATSIYAGFFPTPELIESHASTYAGSWLEQMPTRAVRACAAETMLFGFILSWICSGMMLVGMALYRTGVFQATRRTRDYVLMVLAGGSVGLPLLLVGVHQNFSRGWDPAYSMFHGRIYSECAAPFMAIGWIALIMLWCKSGRFKWLTERLRDVGQMALSNYLFQSIVCSFIFYGHGLGLVNQIDRVGQQMIVVVMWAVQCFASTMWLRSFRFGPVEWLWRTLSYGKRPPMRRATPILQAPAPTTPLQTATTIPRHDSVAAKKPLAIVWRVLIFAALAIGGHLGAVVITFALKPITKGMGGFILQIMFPLVVLLSSWFCLRFLDRRPLKSMGIGLDRPWFAQLPYGMIMGAALAAGTWMIMDLAGWAQLHSGNTDQPLKYVVAIIFCFAIAAHEELLCRGYLFQVISQRSKSLAILVTGLLFVIPHLHNAGATEPLTILNLTLAHLMYVAVYLKTRSLWPVIGLHFAWNFTRAFVFGLPLSGLATTVSVIRTELPHGIWTGNEFGIEGGLIATFAFIAAALVACFALRQRRPSEDLMTAISP